MPGDRRQDVIDSEGSCLASDDAPLLFRERGIAGRSDGHCRWPESRIAESHAHTGLQVCADQQRYARRLLQLLIEERRLVDVRHEPDEAANVVVLHLMQ